MTNSITDDNGYTWRFDGKNIRCDGDDSEGGGYDCNTFDDGVALLRLYGYVSVTPAVTGEEEKS